VEKKEKASVTFLGFPPFGVERRDYPKPVDFPMLHGFIILALISFV
jgi:hypothetical protein